MKNAMYALTTAVLIAGTAIVVSSAPAVAANSVALKQMELAFVGNPSQTTIQRLLDRALKSYGMSINEENYSRVGSTLVRMRKEFGPKEIDILNCVVSQGDMPKSVTIPNGIAICTTLLTP